MESNIKTWLSVDDQIKTLNKKLKELKESKVGLSATIVEYMQKNNIDHCNLHNGETIMLKKSLHYCAIKKEDISDAVKDLLTKPINKSNPTEVAEETAETLFSNREAKENTLLKRIKSK